MRMRLSKINLDNNIIRMKLLYFTRVHSLFCSWLLHITIIIYHWIDEKCLKNILETWSMTIEGSQMVSFDIGSHLIVAFTSTSIINQFLSINSIWNVLFDNEKFQNFSFKQPWVFKFHSFMKFEKFHLKTFEILLPYIRYLIWTTRIIIRIGNNIHVE